MGRSLHSPKMSKMKFIISLRKSFNRVGASGTYPTKWTSVTPPPIMPMKERESSSPA